MIEGETPATHFKFWIFHIFLSFYLIQNWFNHIDYFFVFLNLSNLAEEEEYNYAYGYLNWQDAPIAYWKVFEEIYRKGDGESDTKGGGYVTKLMPEGIAESLAGIPGIEVERHETNEDGSY